VTAVVRVQFYKKKICSQSVRYIREVSSKVVIKTSKSIQF
jgi:hypothetical protein